MYGGEIMDSADQLFEEDLREIARLIEEGYTSGHLDNEDGRRIHWTLKTEIWNDLAIKEEE